MIERVVLAAPDLSRTCSDHPILAPLTCIWKRYQAGAIQDIAGRWNDGSPGLVGCAGQEMLFPWHDMQSTLAFLSCDYGAVGGSEYSLNTMLFGLQR